MIITTKIDTLENRVSIFFEDFSFLPESIKGVGISYFACGGRAGQGLLTVLFSSEGCEKLGCTLERVILLMNGDRCRGNGQSGALKGSLVCGKGYSLQ